MTIKTIARGAILAGALALAAGSVLAQSGDGEDRTIQVHNNSDATIVSIQATNTGVNNWGDDILEGTLAPGEEAEGTIDDGSGACNFDFRITLDNGQTPELRNYNVCTGSGLTVE